MTQQKDSKPSVDPYGGSRDVTTIWPLPPCNVWEVLSLVERLASALLRQGTEQDGNWGWPATKDELEVIAQRAKELQGNK